MNRSWLLLVLVVSSAAPLLPAQDKGSAPKAAFPRFRMQEIETGLTVGYAVLAADVNGDKKPDIVIVDSDRVVWYENPTWKRRNITTPGMTKRDNVCIDAFDIDGDGHIDFALGAEWRAFNTREGGTLQWLKRGKNLDEPWTVYPIGEEPTLHRIRFADIDGTGKPALIVGPLMGKNATAKGNWTDGAPVRVLAYRIPKDPERERWPVEVLDKSLHVMHNFAPVAPPSGKVSEILTASYEGVNLLSQEAPGKWKREHIGEGNQTNPKGNRGASEIKRGRLKEGVRKYVATVEPWHGHQVVVYTATPPAKKFWDRHVIDEKLKWGHAVACADLDGDGSDELIIGVRDDLSKKPGERRGVRVYKALDGSAAKWARHIVEDGGVAVEDMTVADLNGDGRPDIIAVGRQTGNARIYWNEGVK